MKQSPWFVVLVAVIAGCPIHRPNGALQVATEGSPPQGAESIPTFPEFSSRRSFGAGEAWLAAVTANDICIGVRVSTNASVSDGWQVRLGNVPLTRRTTNNSSTAQSYVYSFISCGPARASDSEIEATIEHFGQSQGGVSWPRPTVTSREITQIERRLQWQARLAVYPDGAKDARAPGQITTSPTLSRITPKEGTFIAGEVRRRDVCDAEIDIRPCYERMFGARDISLCAVTTNPKACATMIRTKSLEWYPPSDPRLVVVLVTTAGPFISSPYLGDVLGKIDTTEEARLVAAMVSDKWDDSRVLEAPGQGYFVFSSPQAFVSPEASVARGISSTCWPAPSPAWAQPSLECHVESTSSSCNGLPSLVHRCAPRTKQLAGD